MAVGKNQYTFKEDITAPSASMLEADAPRILRAPDMSNLIPGLVPNYPPSPEQAAVQMPTQAPAIGDNAVNRYLASQMDEPQAAPSASGSSGLYQQMIDLQTKALGREQEGLAGLEGKIKAYGESQKTGGFDITPLLKATDIYTGSNFSKNFKGPKTKEEKDKEMLGLESLLQKHRTGASKSELDLLKTQLGYQKNQAKASTKQTVGQEAAERAFGKDYAAYGPGGGYASIMGNIKKLRGVSKILGSGEDVSGGATRLFPYREFHDKRGMAVQADVESVVQQSLKQILGGAFSEKEATALIKRAYDPLQDEKENKRRVDALLNQLEIGAAQKQRAVDYYERTGSISGFKSMLPTMSDFDNVISGLDDDKEREYQDLLAKKKMADGKRQGNRR